MRALIVFVGVAVLASTALAQQLADPMRPPVPVPDAPTSRGPAPTEPVLHTIIIGPERRYAVIGHHTVTQGSRVGNARVVRIAETEVTLRGAAGETKVLKLLPQAQKKMLAPPRAGRETMQGQEG